MEGYFVGTIEPELNGDLRVEGYLFDDRESARFYSRHRLRRTVNHIITLVLGKLKTQEINSNRPELSA